MLGCSFVAFACNDETVEEVSKDVCYSGMRWIGDKRGSPEMFPGQDCVGCHIENDGPPLAIGGTLYPYVLNLAAGIQKVQSGEHCFGIGGIAVAIEDADGQTFEVTTNRAGNFYVEGNPDDFAKPFSVQFDWINPATGNTQTARMFSEPSYGGCARCHTPDATANPPPGTPPEDFPLDEIVNPQARIGLPGYGPGADGYVSIDAELKALADTL